MHGEQRGLRRRSALRTAALSDAPGRGRRFERVPPRDVCYDPADQYGCRFLEEIVQIDYRTIAMEEPNSASVHELVRR